ncbi:metallophosphoesterase [Levilactobacillus brevis]|uniref:metallophosphoesterase n=1 Tax=Levilactobacillus brevis TaxID=1580 RepID=UPI000B400675|nr:metallophosphoesterase [Levilactobacillus brevis]
MTYIFIGDIHSAADDLAVLLQAPTLQDSRLIFLGDYIDGSGSRAGTTEPALLDTRAVLDMVMNRVDHYQDVALLGNHDDFWLQTARGDDLSFQTWHLNGGAKSWRQLGIHSSNPLVVAKALNQAPLVKYTKFFARLPLTWSTDHLLAVHAGIDWDYPLNRQVRDDLMWIRDPYYFDTDRSWHRNSTGKVIVTGHTPVQTMPHANYGCVKMQADTQDTPRYLIDAGSRSGAADGGIFALTLAETGAVIAKSWVINRKLVCFLIRNGKLISY